MRTDPEPLRIALVPGVTVAKWTRAWRERRRNSPLSVTPIEEDQQIAVLHDGGADLSFVRLPIDREGLNVIRLYGEVEVAVLSKDHPLAEAESLTDAELSGEIVRPEGAEEAIEIVAAGVGIMRVPHSVARQYNRKDVVAIPVTDAPETQIAVAWLEGHTTPDIEEFVGIVRGRRPGSSRGGRAAEGAPAKTAAAPKKAATTSGDAQKKPARSGPAPAGGKAKAKPPSKRPPKSKARSRKKTGRG